VLEELQLQVGGDLVGAKHPDWHVTSDCWGMIFCIGSPLKKLEMLDFG